MLRAAVIAVSLVGLIGSAAAEPPKKPSKAQQLIDEGRRHLSEERFTQAEAAFRAAIKAAPSSAIAHNELGVALFQRGATQAAIEPFTRATKLNKGLANAWANLAEAQRLSGKFKRAALSYHRFLGSNKGDRYGLYGMGLSFEGYESFDKALRTLQVAEKAAEADARLLARIHRSIRRVHEKMAEAKLSLLTRGDARLLAGHWKEAQALYEKGLAEKKGDATYLGRRGMTRAILGDLAGAKADLRSALLADPTEPVARAAFVIVLDHAGEPGLGPVGAGTENGATMLGADRAALAFEAFSRLLESQPDSAKARLWRGEASLRLGLLDQAEEDFGGQGRDAAFGRADVQVLRGKPGEARAESPNKSLDPADIPVWRRSLLVH